MAVMQVKGHLINHQPPTTPDTGPDIHNIAMWRVAFVIPSFPKYKKIQVLRRIPDKYYEAW